MKYDVAIIGGGPAGYTAAERAAQGGLSTILFEKNALGGVCLNEGCVPTKTLLYSAKTYDNIKHASKYAVKAENPSFDLPKIIARKNKVVKKLTAGIRMKMTEHGVVMVTAEACIQGRATDGTITIAAGEELYEAANLLICTGSETVIPPIPGLAETEYWTSREALQSKELPAASSPPPVPWASPWSAPDCSPCSAAASSGAAAGWTAACSGCVRCWCSSSIPAAATACWAAGRSSAACGSLPMGSSPAGWGNTAAP